MIVKNKMLFARFITSLLIFSLACSPTITLGLGLGEIALIIFLAIVLFGPLIFGLIRRITRFKDGNDKR